MHILAERRRRDGDRNTLVRALAYTWGLAATAYIPISQYMREYFDTDERYRYHGHIRTFSGNVYFFSTHTFANDTWAALAFSFVAMAAITTLDYLLFLLPIPVFILTKTGRVRNVIGFLATLLAIPMTLYLIEAVNTGKSDLDREPFSPFEALWALISISSLLFLVGETFYRASDRIKRYLLTSSFVVFACLFILYWIAKG